VTDLPTRLRAQAEQCALHGSPLTGALLYGAADDYDQRGPAYDLMAPLADDPSGTVPSLRLAGALHRLVLERRAPELALYYPSVGGTGPVTDVWKVARRTIADHLDELRKAARRPVQTNEVGRSAALYGGLLHVVAATGLPVRLLEIGASAGLNLLVDRFAYDIGDGVVLGDPASPVVLHRPWSGNLPPYDVLPQVLERAGCDPAPLHPASIEDQLTLTSYVWADQLARVERLRGALALAVQHGVAIERLPASGFLARELAAARDGVVTVVWHSVVWQYLTTPEQAAVEQLLNLASGGATEQAPLAHLRLEPARVVGTGDFGFHVTLTTWPGGEQRLLAEAEGHGPPVVWQ
jgi:hypothetical protein